MGILGDIARRDLSGGRTKEKILRPQSLIDLREIINEEIDAQGKNVDLRDIAIPPNVDALKCLFFLDSPKWNLLIFPDGNCQALSHLIICLPDAKT